MFNDVEVQCITKSMERYLRDCYVDPSLQQQHLSGSGPTFLLEEKLRHFYGKSFVVVFSNATTALQTLALALDLRNAEIITSPINWGGSIAPFLLHGNRLRFASYDPHSLNLSVNDLLLAITPKTRALLSVDYNGIPADSRSIKEFCAKFNLLYISDSAQSLGAFKDGHPAGFFADVIVLSFSPGKSLFAGEGGAVLTDDGKIYQKVLWFSQHPSRQKTVGGLSYYNEYSPINGRINPLATILLYEIFDVGLARLKQYQQMCFGLIKHLSSEGLIAWRGWIDRAEASTYFNIGLELVPSVSIEMVNLFLKQHNHPFVARVASMRLIPFDPSFIRQFKGRFSCTKSVRDLRKRDRSIKRITLHNSSTLLLTSKNN